MSVNLSRRSLAAYGAATVMMGAPQDTCTAAILSPLVRIYKVATDGVVRIKIETVKGGTRWDDLGSGVIAHSGGVVLTAGHLAIDKSLFDAASIRCSVGKWAHTSNAREANMEVVSKHPTADLAIMRITDLSGLESYNYNVVPLTVASAANFGPGTEIAVIDFELQLPLLVTKGVIRGYDTAQNLMIIDAPINPGSSGGAIIPLDTADAPKVIGIVKGAIRQINDGTVLAGIGYATPADPGLPMVAYSASAAGQTQSSGAHGVTPPPPPSAPPPAVPGGAVSTSAADQAESITFRSFVRQDEFQSSKLVERSPQDSVVEYVVVRRPEQGYRVHTAQLDSVDSAFKINSQKANTSDGLGIVQCLASAGGRWADLAWQGSSDGHTQLPLAMTTQQVPIA